jgi:hypothetical protein
MKAVLSCVAAFFLMVRADAFAQPSSIEAHPSFSVRILDRPGQPRATVSGTVKPTSRHTIPHYS